MSEKGWERQLTHLAWMGNRLLPRHTHLCRPIRIEGGWELILYDNDNECPFFFTDEELEILDDHKRHWFSLTPLDKVFGIKLEDAVIALRGGEHECI